MSWLALGWTAVLGLAGVAYVTAGTIGLFRFGDLRGRLHALTKADGLGLGLVLLALAPHVGSVAAVLKLALLWLLTLAASSLLAYVLARQESA